jgi:hypothetical protein
MLVQEIILEVNAIGKGDYAGFAYNQTSPTRIEVTYPDGTKNVVANQADAKRLSDQWNAKNRPSVTPKSDADDPKKPAKTPASKEKSTGIVRTVMNKSFMNLYRVGKMIGFSQLPQVVGEYQLLQAQILIKYQREVESGVDEKTARANFEAESHAAFGQWVASSGVITLGAEAIVKLAAKGGGAVVTAIRSWNAGTSIAAGATGVGLLPAIIKFVLIEGAVLAVTYALSYMSVAKSVFTYLLGASHDFYIKALYASADMGQVTGSYLSDIVGDEETRAAWRDVKNAMGMDPMRKQTQQAIGGAVEVKPNAGKAAPSLSSYVD